MESRSSILYLQGNEIARTPLLVPSFSSKGFPEADTIVGLMSAYLTESSLVSAYDLSFSEIKRDSFLKLRSACNLLFVDSGGYEASKDHDLSDAYRDARKSRRWSETRLSDTLKKLDLSRPTALISFDSPQNRRGISEQIDQAEKLLSPFRGKALTEILLKPERKGDRYLPIGRIAKRAKRLHSFDIVGVTEKELGASFHERIQSIVQLRRDLDDAGVKAPIHVFGSLDTLFTCLYYAAGAEIFDGLTWLRFGFQAGRTVYLQSLAVEELNGTRNVRRSDKDLLLLSWTQNFYYLQSLQTQMARYHETKDYDSFRFIGASLRDIAKDF